MCRHTSVMRALAKIHFDEAHSNAWTIRSDIAAEINPSHPADSSYARAAEILRAHDFEVTHEGALEYCSLADLKRFAVDLA